MIKSKNISLDDECIKKMESLVNRHQGNFSAAIRELIDSSQRSVLPERASAVDEAIFNWLLNETDGRLIPDNVLDGVIDPLLINRLNDLDKYINRRMNDLGWGININIEYDNVLSPSQITVEIIGTSYKIKLVARMISQFIVKNSNNSSPFTITSVSILDNNIKVELIKTSNKKDAINSLITFFGNTEDIARAVKNRTVFWKCIINRHELSNYQMVTIHRNYFEDVLAGKIPMGEIMIETIAKKPIEDISLKEMLGLIKQVYETSKVVDKVDIRNEKIILFHSYRHKEAIERIKKQLVMLLETNGHLYNGKCTTNMIILEHRPEIGLKINEIVNNLKDGGSKLDHELIMFLSFLKGLKHMPDTPMYMSVLGRRIGTTLLQEYENENNIKNWNLENFQKAFEIIDSKIHRESEWKLDGKNLLYRIRKCNITMEGDNFDAYICRTAREAFKGALYHAFGNRAELGIKKLITHGDNICEVTIKIKDVERTTQKDIMKSKEGDKR